PCSFGSGRQARASSRRAHCHKNGWAFCIAGRLIRDEPRINAVATYRYTHSKSCRRPARRQKSPLPKQCPPVSSILRVQILSQFAEIISGFPAWNLGTKGTVQVGTGDLSSR